MVLACKKSGGYGSKTDDGNGTNWHQNSCNQWIKCALHRKIKTNAVVEDGNGETCFDDLHPIPAHLKEAWKVVKGTSF